MFEVGFWEMALCLAIALVVLGPEKLPGVVRTLGRWTGRARVYVRNLTAELEREADRSGVKSSFDEARRLVQDRGREARTALEKLAEPPRERKEP